MRQLMLSAMLLTMFGVQAQVKTEITMFNLSGPYAVTAPLALDTVDAQGKKFDEATMMRAVAVTSPATGKFDGQVIPSLADSKSVGLLSFYVNNGDYLKGKITVKGPKNYKLFIDGQEAGEELKLAPEHHTIAIKYLAEPSDSDSIRVTIEPTTNLTTLNSQLLTLNSPTPTSSITSTISLSTSRCSSIRTSTDRRSSAAPVCRRSA